MQRQCHLCVTLYSQYDNFESAVKMSRRNLKDNFYNNIIPINIIYNTVKRVQGRIARDRIYFPNWAIFRIIQNCKKKQLKIN
jgi:hypothetical protein